MNRTDAPEGWTCNGFVPVAMWMEAYGGWGRNSGDGNASGMNHSVGGFVLGADTMVAGNWRVGGMVGYGHSTFNSRAVDSYGHSNNVSIGGYAGTHWGRLAFRMGAAYTWNMLSTGHDYEELPVTSQHAVAVGQLPDVHRDPFDRILVAQATVEGLLLLTHDPFVQAYPGPIRAV